MLRLVLRLIGQVGFEQFESSSVRERFRLLLRLIGQVLGGIFKLWKGVKRGRFVFMTIARLQFLQWAEIARKRGIW